MTAVTHKNYFLHSFTDNYELLILT